MVEYVIVILLIVLIFKDELKGIFKDKSIKSEEPDEAVKSEVKKRKEEFDKLMSYSIDKAIDSKRGAK